MSTALGVGPPVDADRCRPEPPHRVRAWCSGGLHPIAALLPAAVLLGAAVAYGLPAGALVRCLVVVAATQLAPGVIVWRAVRPRAGWWAEDVAAGLAVGSGLAVPAQVVAGSVGWPLLAALPGPAAAVALLAAPGTRRRVRSARCGTLPHWYGPALAVVGCALIPPGIAFQRATTVAWGTGFHRMYVDLPYLLSLAAELATRGPRGMPFLQGEPLLYHWFYAAWTAQVGGVAHVPLDQVLFRFEPALLPVVATTAVAAAALRVSRSPVAGVLAAVLAVAATEPALRGTIIGGLAVSGGASPTTTFAVAPMATAISLLIAIWRGEAMPGAGAVLLALAVTAGGGKGSSLPPLLGGAALSVACAVFRHREARRSVLRGACLVGLALLTVEAAVFRGATQGTRLDPELSLRQLSVTHGLVEHTGGAGSAALQTAAAALLVVLLLAKGGGLLGLAVDRGWHRPERALLVGATVTGALATVALSQSGQSQMYFFRSATVPLSIGAGWGLALLADRIRDASSWKPAVVGVLAGVPALAAAQAVANHGDGKAALLWAWLGVAALGGLLALVSLVGAMAVRGRRPAALLASLSALLAACVLPGYGWAPWRVPDSRGPSQVAPTTVNGFSADQVRAARWLRAASGRYDVVATNRHCAASWTRPGLPTCDSRRFFVAAYTERQVLVEGWAYGPTWARRSEAWHGRAFVMPFWDAPLLQANDSFFRSPSSSGADRLRRLGVRWLFVDLTAPHRATLAPFAVLRFRTRWAEIYELRAATSLVAQGPERDDPASADVPALCPLFTVVSATRASSVPAACKGRVQ